jgi:hypothetical protein
MPEGFVQEEWKELMRGAVDLHVHTAPDVFPRKLDDLEAARQAQEVGLRGVVLKNHFFPTMDRAFLGEAQTGFHLMGGITLNKTVGGLNPYAVDAAVKAGAKVVWMPTIHSLTTVGRPDLVSMFEAVIGPGEEGIPVTQEGRLVPQALAVLETIRDADVILATGHIRPSEIVPLVREAVRMNLRRIVLTHPLSSLVGMGLAEIQDLKQLSPAVHVEFTCFDCCSHIRYPMTQEQVAGYIAEIGCEHVILTSDGGQTYNPYPLEMLGEMVAALKQHFGEEEIRRMVVENPGYLVHLA